jgi:hypothetical protein
MRGIRFIFGIFILWTAGAAVVHPDASGAETRVPAAIAHPDDNTLRMTAESVDRQYGMRMRDGWRARSGDDPRWASPDLNDSAWEVLNSLMLPDARRPSAWNGI